MAYSKTEWQVVQAFFENGLSLSEIAARPEVKIKDKSTISRRSKLEGWSKGKNQPLVEKVVQAKQILAYANDEKSTMNSTEAMVHDVLVEERTKHIQFFTEAAVLNVREAVSKIGEGTTQAEHRMLAETILKGKEAVLGKTPDTAIQINNGNAEKSNRPSPERVREIIEMARTKF